MMPTDANDILPPDVLELAMESAREVQKEAEKPKRVWSSKERLLLPLSLLIAILFDRLVISLFMFWPRGGLLSTWNNSREGFAIFWLCYLLIFCAFYWQRIKADKVLWFVTACTVALCLWSFVFYLNRNVQYTQLTYLVIPGVLMAHAQWTVGGYSLKKPGGIVIAWLLGWFVKPFSGLFALLGSSLSMISKENTSRAKYVVIGLLTASLLMLIVIPLLMGADMVFNYYVSNLFSGWNFSTFVLHSFIVLVFFGLFYSFIWNVGYGKKEARYDILAGVSIDIIISAIVLGSIIVVYTLFCLVQFTYLFAGAGLPEGMTYSEYAREGFAQTVAVCAINLLLFGVFLKISRGKVLLTGLLSGLLALTTIMLISGAVRLNLYIGAYGMTWLRLLSAWFVIYLAMIIILCAARLYKKDLPVVGISALLLLIWYVALGYLNPDGFINWYNQIHFPV